MSSVANGVWANPRPLQLLQLVGFLGGQSHLQDAHVSIKRTHDVQHYARRGWAKTEGITWEWCREPAGHTLVTVQFQRGVWRCFGSTQGVPLEICIASVGPPGLWVLGRVKVIWHTGRLCFYSHAQSAGRTVYGELKTHHTRQHGVCRTESARGVSVLGVLV